MANNFHRPWNGEFGTKGEEKAYNMGFKNGILKAAEHFVKQGIAIGVNMAAKALRLSGERMWDIIKANRPR